MVNIVKAIKQAEAGTSGEIRVHVKRGETKDAMAEAKRLFLKMGMHKTRERNGVLIFVSKKGHQFAIIGDEGIDRKVGVGFWNGTRDIMQKHFAAGEWEKAVEAGVRSAGEKLKAYFPARDGDLNELSNTVTEG